MIYTVSKEANKKIEQDMKLIVEELRKKIRGVLSIILTGGFSRGEGSVKKIDGKFYPYNDYDIQVLTETKLSKDEVDRISIEISRKLGYGGIGYFYNFKKEESKFNENFYIDLKVDKPDDLKKLLPRIRNYELKKESVILYGEDLRNLIPEFSLKEIPLGESAKLLLDRMSQMIEYYSIEGKHDKEFLNYIIQQVYAACCTSLLMLKKKYEKGYKRAMEIFKENYKKDFPELYEKIPDLDDKIKEFINWRINPQKLLNKNVEEEWFVAQKNIFEVAKYFFSKFLKKPIRNTDEFAFVILGMRKEFYDPYLKFMLDKKIRGLRNFSELFLPFASFLLKYKYYQRVMKFGKQNLRIFIKKSPDLIIFSSLIYFFMAINKEGVDKRLLNKGRDLLNNVFKCDGKNWEELSLDYTNAYIAFFMQKL